MIFNKNKKDNNQNKIIQQVKENPDNFKEIIELWHRPLYNFIRRISYFEKEDIEDIIQEVFIKVYKNLNSFDPDLKFSSWIYRIARNQTTDAIRKYKTRPNTICLDQRDLAKIFKSSLNLEQEIQNKQDFEVLKKTINEIPYKYREVLILRFIEQKDYKEIMDILKKPKGTVATLLNRGKKKLQKKLKIKNFLNN